jgi:hypothetical protein
MLNGTDDQVAEATSAFPCQTVEFPIKYLGIPLSVTKLPSLALQQLIDRIADCLPIGKGQIHVVGHPSLHRDRHRFTPLADQSLQEVDARTPLDRN